MATVKSVTKKLPEVTLAFWIMKIAATTLGETAGDLFAPDPETWLLPHHDRADRDLRGDPGRAASAQRCYNPFFYWMVILSTSTAGTTMSDFMNRDGSARYLANGARDFAGAGDHGASASATRPARRS
ncbi:hypothetical protein ACRAWF_41270 [Streptomyces sp. L7]